MTRLEGEMWLKATPGFWKAVKKRAKREQSRDKACRGTTALTASG
jgi:hypothetical protein